MRYSLFTVAFLIALSLVHVARAEQLWIPKAVESLQQSASSKSGISFDHSMLVLAAKLDPGDNDLRRIIAGIDGLSVRTYHFGGSAQYDIGALNAANEDFRAAGWKRIVSKGERAETPGLTDAWVRIEKNAITNVALLIAKPTEVTFIAVSGSISPIDLFHLCGHFGIPSVKAGIEVPNHPHQ